MEHVIIGLSDRSKGAVIKELVVTSGFLDVELCTSGEEILRLANAYAGGIVICGYKVGSMLYSQVQEMLPPQFGFLLLLSRNQAALVEEESDAAEVLVLPEEAVPPQATRPAAMEMARASAAKRIIACFKGISS